MKKDKKILKKNMSYALLLCIRIIKLFSQFIIIKNIKFIIILLSNTITNIKLFIYIFYKYIFYS